MFNISQVANTLEHGLLVNTYDYSNVKFLLSVQFIVFSLAFIFIFTDLFRIISNLDIPVYKSNTFDHVTSRDLEWLLLLTS
jgi:TRAP-type mannitol/chloroaromatic compound transport system permease large subunit